MVVVVVLMVVVAGSVTVSQASQLTVQLARIQTGALPHQPSSAQAEQRSSVSAHSTGVGGGVGVVEAVVLGSVVVIAVVGVTGGRLPAQFSFRSWLSSAPVGVSLNFRVIFSASRI